MEFAAKYALVPEEEFTKHVPTKKQMSELDVAMSKILNSSLPDHQKVQQYYELLKRKMDLQEFNTPWVAPQKQEEEEPIKQEPQQEDYDSFILASVPKPMKKQAEGLLVFLKSQSKTFTWDKTGTITYRGEKWNASNLAELFHLIFNLNKKPPVAAQNEFLQALREMGVPQTMIKNKHLSNKSPRRHFVKQKKRDVTAKWEKY